MARKAKPGYKLVKSLFGKYEEIPENWNLTTFDDSFDFLSTATNSRSDLMGEGDVNYIHYGDIHSKWNIMLDCKTEKIPFIDIKKVKNIPHLQEGDIVIADASEDHEGSGTSILMKNVDKKKIVAGLHTIALRDKNQNTSIDFRAYLTTMNFVKKQIIGRVTGISVYGLTKKNLRQITIPLPPLSEQQKIASILSTVDDTINKYDDVIKQTKQLKQGLMQQLLTKGIGHKNFKKVKWLFGKEIEIPEEWNDNRLLELSEKITDGEHLTPKRQSSGIMLLSARNVKNGFIDLNEDVDYISKEEFSRIKKRCNPEPDDILISCSGTIGRVTSVKIKEPFGLVRSVALIKLKKPINSLFIEYFLQSKYAQIDMKSNQHQSSQPNLFQSKIAKLRIFLPDVNEQQKIASILSSVDKKITKLESKKKSLESIKKGLMQKLLTGKIRVKV